MIFPAGAKQLKIVINGNEETITRTPNHSAKTVKTESSKGWEKNETFNNLGLATSSVLSGPCVPAAALAPTWRADPSLASVSLTIGGETHSADFNNDGTLASLNAPGWVDILGGHGLSGGTETLTVDGTTTARNSTAPRKPPPTTPQPPQPHRGTYALIDKRHFLLP